MNGNDHKQVSELSFSLWLEIAKQDITKGYLNLNIYSNFGLIKLTEKTGAAEWNSAQNLLNNIRDLIANANAETDKMKDLEFVNVESGRDSDPHAEGANDEPSHNYKSMVFTAFNHFIDIGKGTGIFDDYDGYSYRRGSGSKNEYQKASEEEGLGWLESIIAAISGKLVDEGANWYYNDEYVHAPCHSGYKHNPPCSPSIERYSFPKEKGIYKNSLQEFEARFPLAESTAGENKGIPYSVFMPVDNLGRYWYNYFINNYGKKDDAFDALGRVMHAIQDASVPHHAYGCLGNWHTKYENDLQDYNANLMRDASFYSDIKYFFNAWNRLDPLPPNTLSLDDLLYRVPARNWRIDLLITWVALNSYNDYISIYKFFQKGYFSNETSMRRLSGIAIAMSALVLAKAFEAKDIAVYMPNSLKAMARKAGYLYSRTSVIDLGANVKIKPTFTIGEIFDIISEMPKFSQ